MTAISDIIQAILTLPIGINLSILLVGITIGSYLGKREAKGTSDQFIQDYRTQKAEIWVEFKKQLTGAKL